MPVRFVIDASALLAFVRDEPGADRVAAVLSDCVISTVNLGEAVTALVNRGYPAEEARRIMAAVRVDSVPLEPEVALDAGALREPTRSLGLSFGDRVCLSLAAHMDATALTCDRKWTALDIGIAVELIR